ncbi:MAG: hypothetical protein PHD31_00800 [Candidatus Pacebacteria bacterium]|nr:hypothetical protein [Candidatus Paceibacterota bacterium]
MEQENFLEKQESNIAIHVFSVSSAMIGVCFTVIGIINFISVRKTIVDEITAADALIFLVACVSSYIAMKTKDSERRFLLEKRVDVIFMLGLTLMGFICVFMALNFI